MHLVMCQSLTLPQERNNSKISCSQAEEPSSESWLVAHSIRNHLRRQDRGPKNNNISAGENSWFPGLFDPSVYGNSHGRQVWADRKNTTPQSTTFSRCESEYFPEGRKHQLGFLFTNVQVWKCYLKLFIKQLSINLCSHCEIVT